MAFTVTFKLNVTPLPDNDIWFANSAAWTNYWANQPGGTATINAAPTSLYVPQALDATLPIYDIQVNGVDQYMPSLAMFQSLAAQVTAIDNAFQDLRTQLKAAGFITNAQ